MTEPGEFAVGRFAAGFLLGSGAAVAWGLSSVFVALVSRQLDSLRTLAAWQIMSILAALLIVATGSVTVPAEPVRLLPAILAGILGFGAYLAMFVALALGPISVVSPVIAMNGGLTVVLAALTLGEAVTPLQAAGVALGTLGVILTGIRLEREWHRIRFIGPGVVASLAATLGFALFNVASAPPSRDLGWETAFVASRLTTALLIFLLVILPSARRLFQAPYPTRPREPGRLWLYVLAGGFFSVGGFMLFTVGLQDSYAWLIGLTSSFSPVVVVFAGILLLHESLTRVQLTGIAMVFLSLLLIAA